MSRLTGNKLLMPLVGTGLVGMAGLATMSALSQSDTAPQPRTELPAPKSQPDGDTPVDTIRALRAELTAVNQQMKEVVAQNQELTTTNQTLRDNSSRVEEKLTKQLDEKLAAANLEQSQGWNESMAAMGEEVASLRSSLSAQDTEETPPALADGNDYPVGGADEGYVWIEPLDASPAAPVVAEGDGASTGTDPSNLLNGDLPPAEAPLALGEGGSPSPTSAEAENVEPYFTINNLATLAGSTAFTAMIGRVPIDGEVADPVPFRVLVGRENLAASGLRVPDEIVSMVFEGVGVGDWTLGCVEGSLRTATFIFEDGTIRTVKGGEGQEGRLGYIADRFGTPCVLGERVSNAAGFLAAQVGLAAAGGAAEGLAAAQTTQVIEDGAISSAVIGDIGEFALGTAAADATAEVQQYLADRLSSTFDAIYVPPGQEISLLIQEEITIDYDPDGRRLDHAKGDVPRSRGLD